MQKNMLGENLQIFIGSGETMHTLACATSCSINVNADTIDVSCKDTGKFGASIAGKVSWDVSTDALFVMADGTKSGHTSNYSEMMDALIAGTPLLVTWASVSNFDAANTAGGNSDGHVFERTGDKKAVCANDLYYGYAVLTSCSLTADNGALSTFSIQMQGKGAINKSTKNEGAMA